MRSLLTFLLFATSLLVSAKHISPEEAASVAETFLNRPMEKSPMKAPGKGTATPEQPFYAFNAADNAGFVLVSGDDRAPRILGYSDTGTFDFENLPPQLAAILDSCAVNVKSLPETPHASWKAPTRAASTGEGGKLLQTANWGQGYPYNLYTPEIDGQHCPTGCVATAMAIIMKYHNWPDCGRKKHTYWNYLTGEQYVADCLALKKVDS